MRSYFKQLFEGTLTRPQYIGRVLVVTLVNIVPYQVVNLADLSAPDASVALWVVYWLSFVFLLCSTVYFVSVVKRRAADCGWSDTWAVIFIPLFNVFYMWALAVWPSRSNERVDHRGDIAR
jgi:uncharacterized membrane protein YhaH (DUF805 family)